MREAMAKLHDMELDFEVEGEMHADAAIDEEVRQRIFPDAKLSGAANLFIMPNLDSANIAFNLASRSAYCAEIVASSAVRLPMLGADDGQVSSALAGTSKLGVLMHKKMNGNGHWWKNTMVWHLRL